MAIAAWRKQQRISLLQTMAVVVSNTNPEKAQKVLDDLLAEMFPEIAQDRQKSVDKALLLMKEESKVVYRAKPLDEKPAEGWIKGATAIRSLERLRKNRRA